MGWAGDVAQCENPGLKLNDYCASTQNYKINVCTSLAPGLKAKWATPLMINKRITPFLLVITSKLELIKLITFEDHRARNLRPQKPSTRVVFLEKRSFGYSLNEHGVPVPSVTQTPLSLPSRLSESGGRG